MVGVEPDRYFPSAAIEMVGYLTHDPAVASFLLRLLEKKLDGSDGYDLAQADALTMSAGTYSYPGRGTPFDERNPEAQRRACSGRSCAARPSGTPRPGRGRWRRPAGPTAGETGILDGGDQ